MNDRLILAVLALCLAAPWGAKAQATDWSEVLNRYYRYDVAFEACKDLKPSEDDLKRLERAISFVEVKSKLSEEELDERYSALEYESEADTEGFCQEAADSLAGLRATPEDWR